MMVSFRRGPRIRVMTSLVRGRGHVLTHLARYAHGLQATHYVRHPPPFTMDTVKEYSEPLIKFAKDSRMLLNRCTKPDRKGVCVPRAWRGCGLCLAALAAARCLLAWFAVPPLQRPHLASCLAVVVGCAWGGGAKRCDGTPHGSGLPGPVSQCRRPLYRRWRSPHHACEGGGESVPRATTPRTARRLLPGIHLAGRPVRVARPCALRRRQLLIAALPPLCAVQSSSAQ